MKVRDVLMLALARGGGAVLALGAGIIAARFLGPAGQGYYFFAVTLSNTIVQFGHLGLHSSNTYHVSAVPSSASTYLANSVWVSFLGGGLVSLVTIGTIAVSGLWGSVPLIYLSLGALMVPTRLLFLLGSSILLALGRIGAFNLLQTLSFLFVFLAVGAAAFAKVGVAGFLVANVIGWVITAGCVVFASRKWLGSDLKFDMVTFRHGLSYAAKAYVLCILSYLVTRGNVYVLQHSAGAQEVGYYSIAAQCGDAMAIVPSSVAAIIFPNLVRDSRERLRRTYMTTLRIGGFMGLSCLCVAGAALPIVRVVFGSAFEPVVPVLLWSLPGVFFYALTSLLSQYLGSVGIPRALLWIWVGLCIVLFGLARLLIPIYGGRGAGMALSCAYALAFFAEVLLIVWMVRKGSDGKHEPRIGAKEPASA
jgi:O-antigen/teichoic acid export membrane protein